MRKRIKMVENKDNTNITEEKTTKERIFEAAIDLFAQKGFNAASMREIAEAVGIKKASLYSHYKSKDEILEKIVEYPMARLEIIGPQGVKTEELILSMGLEGFMALGSDFVVSWMEDPYMEKIWRIICVEMYHNNQIKKFYSEFGDLTYSFWVSNFNIMIKHNLIKPYDPEILALEFLSFFGNAFMEYFLLHYGKTSLSFQEEYIDRINRHMSFIIDSIKQ